MKFAVFQIHRKSSLLPRLRANPPLNRPHWSSKEALPELSTNTNRKGGANHTFTAATDKHTIERTRYRIPSEISHPRTDPRTDEQQDRGSLSATR
jgi:hypothetical protein